jgi:hypothetical protein
MLEVSDGSGPRGWGSMGETHRIEIEVGDHAYAQLQGEAERLGFDIAEVISRATSAWLVDTSENIVDVDTGVLQGA